MKRTIDKTTQQCFEQHPDFAGAVKIVRHLQDNQFAAFLAGGCVRDALLARKPKDFDVATSARPQEIQKIFPKTVAIGERFGTVGVLQGKTLYHVTTFRADGKYSDHRHPDSIEFSGPKQDALRRDFTVNGLFADPLQQTIWDYVDGVKDLQQNILRTIGNPYERFQEDALRLMRAARFATTYQLKIEETTHAAAQQLASSITQVSAERIRDELIQILVSNHPAAGIRLLDALQLLQHVLPEIHCMQGVEQPSQYHPEGDVYVHTLLILEKIEPKTLLLVLAALLHDVGKPKTFMRAADRIRFHGHDLLGAKMSEEILRRLCLPKALIHQVEDLVAYHLYIADLPKMRAGKRRRFLCRADIQEHLALHRADCLASHGKLDIYDFCQQELKLISVEQLKPKCLLNGNDLIQLGYKPGPEFKMMLTALEEAQLEGAVNTYREATEWVSGKFPINT